MLKRIALIAALVAFGAACPAGKKSDTTPPVDSGGATAPAPTDSAPQGDNPADSAPQGEPTDPPADKPADPPAGGGSAGLPDKAGMPCDDKGCASPYTCVSYYGIAGPKGPEFRSCEIPCPKADSKCPAGTTCTTIADGPGRVCR